MGIDRDAAPVWRRICAGAVDGLLVTGLGAAIVGAPVLWAWLADEAMTDLQAGFRRRVKEVVGEGETATRRSERLDLALHAVRIPLRHRPSPGERLLGIRRADAGTGRPATVRGTLTLELLRFGLSRALVTINAPRRTRIFTEQAELERETEELQERLADDPEALAEAMTERARARGSSCWRAVAPVLAIALAEPLTTLLSPRRQSLIERLAGVAVVRVRA